MIYVKERYVSASTVFRSGLLTSRNDVNADFEIYERIIPDFARHEIDRLYESIYASIDRLEIYGDLLDTSTYVAKFGGSIVDVFLFKLVGRRVIVLNEQIRLKQGAFNLFCDRIFDRYPGAMEIYFYSILMDTACTRRWCNYSPSLEEYRLQLPTSTSAFDAMLGNSFRRGIASARRRFELDFPHASFSIRGGSDFTIHELHRVAHLSLLRMLGANKDPYLAKSDFSKMLALINRCGHVSLVLIDDDICAASIWYRVGRRNFMHVIAHHPSFDKYKLGHLLQCYTFKYLICIGSEECWLMAGGAYKERFGAKRLVLKSYSAYRNSFAYFFLMPKRTFARLRISLPASITRGVMALLQRCKL